jgi:hypothetical protein
MEFKKIFELQNKYSEMYPDDEFNAFDYFQSLGTDELIKIFKESKGRKITLIMSENDNDQRLINVEYS